MHKMSFSMKREKAVIGEIYTVGDGKWMCGWLDMIRAVCCGWVTRLGMRNVFQHVSKSHLSL